MKIYNISFINRGWVHDDITVSTLKDIEIPLGVKMYMSSTISRDIRMFLEDAFEKMNQRHFSVENDIVFDSFSDVDEVEVEEIRFPII